MSEKELEALLSLDVQATDFHRADSRLAELLDEMRRLPSSADYGQVIAELSAGRQYIMATAVKRYLIEELLLKPLVALRSSAAPENIRGLANQYLNWLQEKLDPAH